MKKLLTILLIVSFGTVHAQFTNTVVVGSPTTLFKSKGGVGADSALVVINSFPDTATANYSVVSKVNSIIRVGSNYFFRTLVPPKWVQFSTGSTGTYMAVADTATMLVNYYNKTAASSTFVPKTVTVAGYPLSSNITLSTLTAGGYTNGVTYNGSSAVSIIPDTSSYKLATKTDIRNSPNWDVAYNGRLASLTTTGTSGAATLVSNVLNVPTYTLSGLGGQPLENQRLSTTDNVVFNSITKSGATASNFLMGDGSTAVVGNGVSLSGGALSLGSSLTSDVAIASSGYQLTFNGGTTVALGSNNIPFRSTSYLTATGSEAVQLATTGVYGGLHIDIVSGSFTPFGTSKHAALSGTVYKTSGGNYSGILPAVFGTLEFSGTGNVTTAAAIRAYRPELTALATYTGTITNAVGVYIDDIGASSVVGQITNKYAIYQVGTSDINLFSGKVMLTGLPTYADNTAASSLPTGQVYKTSTGVLMVKY